MGDNQLVDAKLNQEQEWVGEISSEESPAQEVTHLVEVGFSTDIYGTFRQSVVFDFGAAPALVKHVCVDVMPVTDADKMKELKKVISFINQ